MDRQNGYLSDFCEYLIYMASELISLTKSSQRAMRTGGDTRFEETKKKPGLFSAFWAAQGLYMCIYPVPLQPSYVLKRLGSPLSASPSISATLSQHQLIRLLECATTPPSSSSLPLSRSKSSQTIKSLLGDAHTTRNYTMKSSSLAVCGVSADIPSVYMRPTPWQSS
jgi:hypothetical protein